MKTNLPTLIEKSFEICKRYEERFGLEETISNELKSDMLDMMVYLTDNKTGRSVDTVVFINKLMSTKFDIISIREYMIRRGINKDKFIDNIPLSILDLVKYERESVGFSISFYKDARDVYTMLKELGYYIVSLDGVVLDEEIERLNTYTNRVIKYILHEESIDYLSFDSIGATVKINSSGEHIVEENSESSYSNNTTSMGSTKNFEVMENDEKEQTIEELLNEIDKLIGLDGVKREVHNLVNLIRVQKLRSERGLKIPNVGMHLVFTGNPGTGKTTIARKIAMIYKTLGLLEKGHLVETARSGLVAGYMGQTAAKVEEVVKEALGGVLFIDEAYTLITSQNDDFGKEAVDSLLKEMEDKRLEFAVIVAGYPDNMDDFLESNPGLKSRFNRTINFEDYTAFQLSKIFGKFCVDNQYKLSKEAADVVEKYFEKICLNKPDNFANAREVRNFFEETVTKQANRIMTLENVDDEAIITILPEDLSIEGE